MHTENYEQARQIFIEAIRHPNFVALTPERQEKWKIYEAYLHYATLNENFDLKKFLKEVHIYSKDKRGYNIAVLVIQILFLLKQRKTDEIIDKGDALKLYRSHYLHNHEPFNSRSKCFLKMLNIMIHFGFDYGKTQQTTKEYYKQLQTNHNAYSGNIETMEIIPYEILWKFVLADLKKLNLVLSSPVTESRQKLLASY